jgi:hypothetical protein
MGDPSPYLQDVEGVRSRTTGPAMGIWHVSVVGAPLLACFFAHRFGVPVQDISLMIKPLPAIFRWMGIGPVNLAALFQARVSYQRVPLE